MNSFAELLKTRRSTRKFTDQLLSPDQVEAILKAGLMAPSSKQSTPWQFVVVEDKEMLKQLSLCRASGSAFIEGCAMAVVVMADTMKSGAWIEDASIAAILMQLQAEDLGLGSCWCQVRERVTTDETDSNEYIRRLMDVPYQLDILCVLAFGYKGQERKPFDDSHLQWEKIHIGSYKPSTEETPEA